MGHERREYQPTNQEIEQIEYWLPIDNKRMIEQASLFNIHGHWQQNVEKFELSIYYKPYNVRLERDIDPETQASLLLEYGLASRMLYNYKTAENAFLKALDIARNTNNRSNQLTALAGLMDLYRTGDRSREGYFEKDLDAARMCQETGLSIIAQHLTQIFENNIGEINLLINIALLSWEKGTERAYEEALSNCQLAEEYCDLLLNQRPEDVALLSRRSRIYQIKAATLRFLNKNDEAAAIDNEAYEHYQELGDVRGIGSTANALGHYFRGIGDYESARQWYDKALDVCTDGDTVTDPDIYKRATEWGRDLIPDVD